MYNIHSFLCSCQRKLTFLVTHYKKPNYLALAYCLIICFLLSSSNEVEWFQEKKITKEATVYYGAMNYENEDGENSEQNSEEEPKQEQEQEQQKESNSIEQFLNTVEDKVIPDSSEITDAAAMETQRKATKERVDAEAERQEIIREQKEEAKRKEEEAKRYAQYKYHLSDPEKAILERIVQAEAGNQGIRGKMLVAGVIMNRVNSSKFPDSVSGVVYQHSGGVYQFQPVQNGAMNRANVTSETKTAVDRVLRGEDITDGALFFVAKRIAYGSNLNWFNRCLTCMFSYKGHTFYKY